MSNPLIEPHLLCEDISEANREILYSAVWHHAMQFGMDNEERLLLAIEAMEYISNHHTYKG